MKCCWHLSPSVPDWAWSPNYAYSPNPHRQACCFTQSSFLLPTYSYFFFPRGHLPIKGDWNKQLRFMTLSYLVVWNFFPPRKKSSIPSFEQAGRCDLHDCFQCIIITQLLPLHELRRMQRSYSLLMVPTVPPDAESFKSDFALLPFQQISTPRSLPYASLLAFFSRFSPNFQLAFHAALFSGRSLNATTLRKPTKHAHVSLRGLHLLQATGRVNPSHFYMSPIQISSLLQELC